MASLRIHISGVRHLSFSFHRQKFLMNSINLTRWTSTMLCQMKIMMTLRTPVWRSWMVAAILASMKRANWQGSAEYSVKHKKRHWQRKRQRGTNGNLTLSTHKQWHTNENIFKLITLPRAIFLSINSCDNFNYKKVKRKLPCPLKKKTLMMMW